MGSISSRWKTTLARFWSKAPERGPDDKQNNLIIHKGDAGTHEAPQAADSIIGSDAMRVRFRLHALPSLERQGIHVKLGML